MFRATRAGREFSPYIRHEQGVCTSDDVISSSPLNYESSCGSFSFIPINPDNFLVGQRHKRAAEDGLAQVEKRYKEGVKASIESAGEFAQICTSVAVQPNFESRWTSFLSFFNENVMYYVPEDTTQYRFTVSEGPFRSHAFTKEFFSQFHSECTFSHYYFLQVNEEHGGEDPLIELCITLDGNVAELIWLQKGLHIKGIQVIQLFQQLQNTLKIKNIYLFDDAKISYTKTFKKREAQEFSIRLYRFYPLISESKRPWYEDKLKIKPIQAHNIKGVIGNKTLHQNDATFNNAITFLRALTIAELYALSIYKNQKDLLDKLFKKYFSDNKNLTRHSDLTLNELTVALYNRSKQGSPEDLHAFVDKFLTHYTPVRYRSTLEESYIDALDHLTDLCIFKASTS